MKNVFIIGSKGIPAKYGGFETFVENLTKYQKNPKIKYYVSCLAKDNRVFEHNGATCFNVKVPSIGPAKAIYYDIYAFKRCLEYIDQNKINNAVIYVLACRIGPFFKNLVKEAHKRNVPVYVNPDGHEFMRAKWNYFIKRYWKYSEKLMVKHADLLICDSVNIEKYIKTEYKVYKPRTCFIAYGADVVFNVSQDKFDKWAKQYNIRPNNYYLIVGRFVPENNYETMIREFMTSKSEKDLVIVTNYQGEAFYQTLEKKLGFSNDPRIKFVGAIYDNQLLSTIRVLAKAYLHGHEVGGTNPSLLEALGSTKINLLLDVGFNKEVGLDTCLYWSKDSNSLTSLIEKVDKFEENQIEEYGYQAKQRIKDAYSWELIVDQYERKFL